MESVRKVHDSIKSLSIRMDSFVHETSGKGVAGKDSLVDFKPNPIIIENSKARDWYDSNGFIQNIIDAPAEDATKEWIRIKTNRDTDDNKSGLKGLDVARKILNRLEELDLQSKIKDLVIYQRLFYNGGLLFFGVNADVPQTAELLQNPMPDQIRKLEFINCVQSDYASFQYISTDPLSLNYHSIRYTINGRSIHPSRISWLVNSFDRTNLRGKSILERILEGVFAQDTALWSVTSLIKELSVKIFKTDQLDNLPEDEKFKFLFLMNHALNTQKSVLLGSNESFDRIGNPGLQGTSLRDMLDFIWETIAGLARMPKSKILGQAQGTITAGEYDLESYYESIHKFQELQIRPIIDKVISLVIRETEGQIYKELDGKPELLDWSFEFEPIWRMSPKEEEEIRLSRSQRHQLDITNGILEPTEARKEAYPELEEFEAALEDPAEVSKRLNFDKPELALNQNSDLGKNLENAENAKIA
jgi:phage-related protein (TIGR01555 family)